MIRWAEDLIHQGRWDAQEPETSLYFLTQSPQEQTLETSLVEAEALLSTLPLSLFFHDNSFKLRQMSQRVPNFSELPHVQTWILAIGFAIAQCLKEQLDPLQLIPRTVVYLNHEIAAPGSVCLAFINKLEQIQTLLQEGRNLQAALRLASSRGVESVNGAIAAAFFCFLSTPEEMRLSLLRAAQSNSLPQIVCGLTGTLSGAYNSAAGIPLEWSIIASEPARTLAWNMSGVEICQLATHLFSAWSGVYRPTIAGSNAVAIAAPGVIRPR